MGTLLLRLKGPMQSWGTTSRFTHRDTNKEPSKSGVIGLLASAFGYDRENWNDLQPLTDLRMGVRCDKSGVLKVDYQTSGCIYGDQQQKYGIIKASGSEPDKNLVVSNRFYIADASFIVGLEGDDLSLLKKAHQALYNPKWPLALGRKSYIPSEPVFLNDGLYFDKTLEDALKNHPWIENGKPPEKLLFSFETKDFSGRMLMDQPLSSFSERKFGSRFVISKFLPMVKGECLHVSL